MKLYIAGPMRNIPQFNYPAFDSAAAELRAQKFEIISPSELDDPEDREMAMNNATGDLSKLLETWGTYLARDVKLIIDSADGIIFLPGWQKSKGAKLEAFTALSAGKIHFYWYWDKKAVPAHIDEVRQALIHNMP